MPTTPRLSESTTGQRSEELLASPCSHQESNPQLPRQVWEIAVVAATEQEIWVLQLNHLLQRAHRNKGTSFLRTQVSPQCVFPRTCKVFLTMERSLWHLTEASTLHRRITGQSNILYIAIEEVYLLLSC